MKKNKNYFLGMILVGLLSFTACNKVILHSRDKDFDPAVKTFSAPPEDAFNAAKEALLSRGYKISREDKSDNTLKTAWLSTKADSHYLDLFDRKDYGTVGAYFRIVVHVTDKNGKSEVEISAPIRSIVTGRVRTSYYEEKRIFAKMTDLLRKDDFEITNVGVEE